MSLVTITIFFSQSFVLIFVLSVYYRIFHVLNEECNEKSKRSTSVVSLLHLYSTIHTIGIYVRDTKIGYSLFDRTWKVNALQLAIRLLKIFVKVNLSSKTTLFHLVIFCPDRALSRFGRTGPFVVLNSALISSFEMFFKSKKVNIL